MTKATCGPYHSLVMGWWYNCFPARLIQPAIIRLWGKPSLIVDGWLWKQGRHQTRNTLKPVIHCYFLWGYNAAEAGFYYSVVGNTSIVIDLSFSTRFVFCNSFDFSTRLPIFCNFALNPPWCPPIPPNAMSIDPPPTISCRSNDDSHLLSPIMVQCPCDLGIPSDLFFFIPLFASAKSFLSPCTITSTGSRTKCPFVNLSTLLDCIDLAKRLTYDPSYDSGVPDWSWLWLSAKKRG